MPLKSRVATAAEAYQRHLQIPTALVSHIKRLKLGCTDHGKFFWENLMEEEFHLFSAF